MWKKLLQRNEHHRTGAFDVILMPALLFFVALSLDQQCTVIIDDRYSQRLPLILDLQYAGESNKLYRPTILRDVYGMPDSSLSSASPADSRFF